MHAELGEQVLGLDHDVEQMRHRRALVAADIAHAGLQQRLGDREDAFAAEDVAVAQLERLHFLLERAFHGQLSVALLPSNYYKQAVTARARHVLGLGQAHPRSARRVGFVDNACDALIHSSLRRYKDRGERDRRSVQQWLACSSLPLPSGENR